MTGTKWSAARIAKLFLELMLGLLSIVTVILLVMVLITPVQRAQLAETDLTVYVAVAEGGLLPVATLTLQDNPTDGPGEFRHARLVKTYGELRLLTTRFDLHGTFLVLYLLAVVMVLVVVLALRSVVKNALDGRPFDLRLIGIILLIGGCVWPVAQYLLARAVLAAAAVAGVPLAPASRFSTDPLLIGLLLLVLAAVFSHGADLEEEGSLTV
jgi:hypothetical protein